MVYRVLCTIQNSEILFHSLMIQYDQDHLRCIELTRPEHESEGNNWFKFSCIKVL